MKKKFSVVILLLLCAVSVLFGCSDNLDSSQSDHLNSGSSYSNSDSSQSQPPQVRIELDSSEKTVDRFESFTLKATVVNSDGKAEWSSSAPDVAFVSADGKVTGMAAGSAVITATVENVTATCNVTVRDSGALPVLEIDKTSIQTTAGQQFVLNATLTLGHYTVTTAEFVWEVSDVKKVAILSGANAASATIKTLEKGEAEVTVKTTFDNAEYTKSVAVNIIEEYVMDITNLQPEELAYKKSLTVSKLGDYTDMDVEFIPAINVSLNGEKVADAVITPSVILGNAKAITIDGASLKITAAEPGVATVRFSSTSAMGTESFIDVEITVVKPSITLSDVVEIDLCEQSTRITVAQIALPESVQGDATVFKLDGAIIDFTTESGKLTFDVSADFKAGKKAAFVSTDKADYLFGFLAVSMYVNTVAEFKDLARVIDSTVTGTGEADKTWDGYYVIAENIDLTVEPDGYYVWNGVANDGYIWEEANKNCGFIGTIDGRGNYVRGLKTSNGAFIGRLGKIGVIKNIAFIDAVSESDKVCGIVTDCLGGTIENVMLVGANRGGNRMQGSTLKASAMLTCDLLKNAVLKNCVVYVTDMPDEKNSAVANSIWYADWEKTGNVYAIGATNMLFSDSGIDESLSKGTVKAFATPEEFTEYVATKFGDSFAQSWDNGVWDTDSYGWPAFRSFKGFADTVTTTLLNVSEINAATPAQLTCPLNSLIRSFALNSATEGITVDKSGLVTCSQDVVSGVSFEVKVTTVWGKEFIFTLTTKLEYILDMNAPENKINNIGDKFTPNVVVNPARGAEISLEVKTPSATEFVAVANNAEYVFGEGGDYIFKATAAITNAEPLTDTFTIHVVGHNVINDFYGTKLLNVTVVQECTVASVDGKLQMTGTSMWPMITVNTGKYTDFTQFESLSFEVCALKKQSVIIAINGKEATPFAVYPDEKTVTVLFGEIGAWTEEILKNVAEIKIIGVEANGAVITFDNFRLGVTTTEVPLLNFANATLSEEGRPYGVKDWFAAGKGLDADSSTAYLVVNAGNPEAYMVLDIGIHSNLSVFNSIKFKAKFTENVSSVVIEVGSMKYELAVTDSLEEYTAYFADFNNYSTDNHSAANKIAVVVKYKDGSSTVNFTDFVLSTVGKA